jgi:predicted MFS family arabinose efflux permease
MLPLSLFKNRNFSVGNVATVSIYAGLTASTFLLVVFLQQVGGYSALAAGMALLPVTLIMFFLSSKFGALAGKHGPRWFMGAGPIIASIGFLMMLQLDASINYWTDLLPAIILFGLGLSITVAPLTAAILGDVPPSEAGIASAVNNAVARIAGLVAIAAVGVVIASQFSTAIDQSVIATKSQVTISESKKAPLQTTPSKPYQDDAQFKQALSDASVSAFHAGIVTIAGLLIAGGVISLIGIQNPKPTA